MWKPTRKLFQLSREEKATSSSIPVMITQRRGHIEKSDSFVTLKVENYRKYRVGDGSQGLA